MQPRRSRKQWRQIVRRYEASGLKAVEFAQREGLNGNTFAWWRHELRRETRLTLVPVPSTPTQELVIRFGDGTEIRVPTGIEPGWVGRVAKAMR